MGTYSCSHTSHCHSSLELRIRDPTGSEFRSPCYESENVNASFASVRKHSDDESGRCSELGCKAAKSTPTSVPGAPTSRVGVVLGLSHQRGATPHSECCFKSQPLCFLSGLLIIQQTMAQGLGGPTPHKMADLYRGPGSWIQSGPALAVAGFWYMNQQLKCAVSLSLRLFLSDK